MTAKRPTPAPPRCAIDDDWLRANGWTVMPFELLGETVIYTLTLRDDRLKLHLQQRVSHWIAALVIRQADDGVVHPLGWRGVTQDDVRTLLRMFNG